MNDFPIDRVRREFPALSRPHDGGPRVFMDDPAGTQLPRRVVDAVSNALVDAASKLRRVLRAIPQRGGDPRGCAPRHGRLRERAIAERDRGGPEHDRADPTPVPLAGPALHSGDEIGVTRMDHEGNVSPWLLLAEDCDLVVRWLPFSRDTWKIEPEDLEAVLGPRTRLLALNWASKLTGSINDVAGLTALARSAGAMTYFDAVQLAPHQCIDVQALGCDFLACSSYKFFGPHLGVLWGRQELLDALPAYKARCAPDASPEKWESGTPQTEVLAGLTACVDHYDWPGALVSDEDSRRGRIKAAYRAATGGHVVVVPSPARRILRISAHRLHGAVGRPAAQPDEAALVLGPHPAREGGSPRVHRTIPRAPPMNGRHSPGSDSA